MRRKTVAVASIIAVTGLATLGTSGGNAPAATPGAQTVTVPDTAG